MRCAPAKGRGDLHRGGPGGSDAVSDEVRAVPGRGLEGDRYFKDNGTFLGAAPSRS